MAFRYSCFLSYRWSRFKLGQELVEQLYEALANEIEQQTDLEVFRDNLQVQAGDHVDPSFARALCESVCMVMVYSPRYFEAAHPYCTREYIAMRHLEKTRLSHLPAAEQVHGLIIPIVVRGIEQFPGPKLDLVPKNFDRIMLGMPRIAYHPELQVEVRKVAEYVAARCRALQPLEEVCCQCDAFQLPADADAVDFLSQKGLAPPAQKLPLTGAA